VPYTQTSSVQVMADKNLVLSVNAGSSSLKISLFQVTQSSTTTKQAESVQLLLTSSISGISSPPAKFSFKSESKNGLSIKNKEVTSIKDHATAFAHFLECLQSQASIDRKRIRYLCHRVVHGGDYTEPIEITEESYHHIETLSDLAPL